MAAKVTRRQRVIPMLSYAEGPAAMDWLMRAFGFEEKARWLDDDGRLTHGELAMGEAVIMLATPTRSYEGPRQHREHCPAAAAWHDVPWVIDGVFVTVEDIRAHYARAEAAGATMLSDVERAGFGGWLYRVEDPEGHRWMFAEEDA